MRRRIYNENRTRRINESLEKWHIFTNNDVTPPVKIASDEMYMLVNNEDMTIYFLTIKDVEEISEMHNNFSIGRINIGDSVEVGPDEILFRFR